MLDSTPDTARIAAYCVLDAAGHCSRLCSSCLEQDVATDDFVVAANGLTRMCSSAGLNRVCLTRIVGAIDRLRAFVADR